jgi:hypothetical protein
MATFNTYVKLGTRGNSLLSFNLSGCTNSNTNSCTALPDYQDVLHTRFDGSGLYVTGLTLHSTYFIYVEPNRMVSGHTCNMSLLNQMIPITGIPTPTPTPSPTPLPTATPSPTPTSTITPTPTPTNTITTDPATYTPTPTNTLTPSPTPSPTPTVTVTVTVTPTPTSTPLPGQCYRYRIDENSPINGQLSQYGIRYTYPGSISTDNALNSFMSGLMTVDGNVYNTYSICSSVEPTWLSSMTTPTSGSPGDVPSGVFRDGPLGGCSGNSECL